MVYIRWFLNGDLHRLDNPAIEYPNGDKEWWVRGKCHRLDGPALEWKSGDVWVINNEQIDEQNYVQSVNDFLDKKLQKYK